MKASVLFVTGIFITSNVLADFGVSCNEAWERRDSIVDIGDGNEVYYASKYRYGLPTRFSLLKLHKKTETEYIYRYAIETSHKTWTNDGLIDATKNRFIELSRKAQYIKETKPHRYRLYDGGYKDTRSPVWINNNNGSSCTVLSVIDIELLKDLGRRSERKRITMEKKQAMEKIQRDKIKF